jgi:hypothetical protein
LGKGAVLSRSSWPGFVRGAAKARWTWGSAKAVSEGARLPFRTQAPTFRFELPGE